MSIPAQSLHGELNALAKAGLSNAQVIKTSIINGPQFLDLGNEYGSIASGKVADILILDKNPLENIDNLKKINSVIKSGEVYDRERLNTMLESLR